MVSLPSLRLLLLSTPVGPLGSGLGGGVELTLQNMAQILAARGHRVTVMAPQGSQLPSMAGVQLLEVPGAWQVTAQSQTRSAPIQLPGESVLGKMWERAHHGQGDYDLLVNFAYDWLPFYLTPFFQRPIAHVVSMGSLNDGMDGVMGEVAQRFPGTLGVHTLAQAQTFSFGDQCRYLGNGFDLSRYQFQGEAGTELIWVGRLAPEKGLEDAVAAAAQAHYPLRVLGKIQDASYWHGIQQAYPEAVLHYGGFLPTEAMQAVLGQAQALLMTPRWVEAFGNVVIEALACGVPVIAYRRGGPAELVEDGVTGWLVEPDCIEGLVAAIHRIPDLDRYACRQAAEAHYSLEALGDRLEAWLGEILARPQRD